MVTQAGQEWTGDGLALSLEAHAEEHVKNTRQLLNLSAGRPQAQALPPYNPAEHPWPKHVYHVDGRDMQVADEKAMEVAEKTGFRDKPYPKAPGGADAAKAEAARKLAASDNTISMQTELLLSMRRELDALKTAEPVAAPTVKK